MQALDIGLPVIVAGLLILASHIPLGLQVLNRGIVFIDLAIAQMAALGTVLASQWNPHGTPEWQQQAMAIVFALIGVSIVAWINRKFPDWREAFIGLIYVLSASVLVLVVAGQPQGGQVLTRSLSGDILWLNWSDLLPLLAMAITIQFMANRCSAFLERFFYIAFAITITLSVSQAGIYLVFVCLIAPALASVVNKCSPLWSYMVGTIGFVLGVIVAWNLDQPAAATIVVSIVCCLIMALVLQQQRIKAKVKSEKLEGSAR